MSLEKREEDTKSEEEEEEEVEGQTLEKFWKEQGGKHLDRCKRRKREKTERMERGRRGGLFQAGEREESVRLESVQGKGKMEDEEEDEEDEEEDEEI